VGAESDRAWPRAVGNGGVPDPDRVAALQPFVAPVVMRLIRCVDGDRVSVECLIDAAPRGAFVELVAAGRAVVALSPSDARALAAALVEQAELAEAARTAEAAKLG
jgi:hypothetical protein